VHAVTVSAAQLGEALARVLPAVSTDRKAMVLQCVLVEVVEQSVRLVATDRARLVVDEVPLAGGSTPTGFRALVPATALAAFEAPGSGDVTLRLEDDAVQVRTEKGMSTWPRIQADFPNYERFLAADPDGMTAVVDRAALVDAIEEAEGGSPLRFHFAGDSLDIGEEPPVQVPAQYQGDQGQELTLFLNPTFAHAAAASASGSALVIDAASPLDPVVIRSADDESHTTVVMPIRSGELDPRQRPRRRRRPPTT
jgi:DNA polymerase III sliding clamp (beta) subunit (PCNA family)